MSRHWSLPLIALLLCLVAGQARADPCIPYLNTTYLPPNPPDAFTVWEEQIGQTPTYTWHVRLNDYYWQDKNLYTWDAFAFVVYDGDAKLQSSETSLTTWWQVRKPGEEKDGWYPVAEWRGTAEPTITSLPQSQFAWTDNDRWAQGWQTFTATFDKALTDKRGFAMHLRWNNEARSLTTSPYTGWFNNGLTGANVPKTQPPEPPETTPELPSGALLLLGALPAALAWWRRRG